MTACDRRAARRIRGFLNDMRYINSRFTYLLTYLLTYGRTDGHTDNPIVANTGLCLAGYADALK